MSVSSSDFGTNSHADTADTISLGGDSVDSFGMPLHRVTIAQHHHDPHHGQRGHHGHAQHGHAHSAHGVHGAHGARLSKRTQRRAQTSLAMRKSATVAHAVASTSQDHGRIAWLAALNGKTPEDFLDDTQHASKKPVAGFMEAFLEMGGTWQKQSGGSKGASGHARGSHTSVNTLGSHGGTGSGTARSTGQSIGTRPDDSHEAAVFNALYRDPDRMYKELHDFRKEVAALKAEREGLKTRARKLEQEVAKRDKQIDVLQKTATEGPVSGAVPGAPVTAITATNTEGKLRQLERAVRDRDLAIDRLRNDIKYTRHAELEAELETCYAEIERLKKIAAGSGAANETAAATGLLDVIDGVIDNRDFGALQAQLANYKDLYARQKREVRDVRHELEKALDDVYRLKQRVAEANGGDPDGPANEERELRERQLERRIAELTQAHGVLTSRVEQLQTREITLITERDKAQILLSRIQMELAAEDGGRRGRSRSRKRGVNSAIGGDQSDSDFEDAVNRRLRSRTQSPSPHMRSSSRQLQHKRDVLYGPDGGSVIGHDGHGSRSRSHSRSRSRSQSRMGELSLSASAGATLDAASSLAVRQARARSSHRGEGSMDEARPHSRTGKRSAGMGVAAAGLRDEPNSSDESGDEKGRKLSRSRSPKHGEGDKKHRKHSRKDKGHKGSSDGSSDAESSSSKSGSSSSDAEKKEKERKRSRSRSKSRSKSPKRTKESGSSSSDGASDVDKEAIRNVQAALRGHAARSRSVSRERARSRSRSRSPTRSKSKSPSRLDVEAVEELQAALRGHRARLAAKGHSKVGKDGKKKPHALTDDDIVLVQSALRAHERRKKAAKQLKKTSRDDDSTDSAAAVDDIVKLQAALRGHQARSHSVSRSRSRSPSRARSPSRSAKIAADEDVIAALQAALRGHQARHAAVKKASRSRSRSPSKSSTIKVDDDVLESLQSALRGHQARRKLARDASPGRSSALRSSKKFSGSHSSLEKGSGSDDGARKRTRSRSPTVSRSRAGSRSASPTRDLRNIGGDSPFGRNSPLSRTLPDSFGTPTRVRNSPPLGRGAASQPLSRTMPARTGAYGTPSKFDFQVRNVGSAGGDRLGSSFGGNSMTRPRGLGLAM